MGMSERAFQDRIRQVEDYMKSKDLSTEMKDMVRDFFKVPKVLLCYYHFQKYV